jgi:nucleoside-diphosphate-sugar epimerase
MQIDDRPMKTILITGASGFIGQALCQELSLQYKVIGLDRGLRSNNQEIWVSVKADIEDENVLKDVCNKYLPDVVIHCAGLAHQKISSKTSTNLYEKINSVATEKLAHAAVSANPSVYFIFLSSISVYGEGFRKKIIKETDQCFPTSSYAVSKLDAENRLERLYAANLLKRIDLLRLAPVYDVQWSLNLEKRVFSPRKMFYLRFGSGEQKMSALARQNLVEFIGFRLKHLVQQPFYNIINICDERPYPFNEIIEIFQKTKYQPEKRVINIPLQLVRLPILFMGLLLKNRSVWIHSFYNKLAKDLVFDNQKMSNIGFKHKVDLRSVFLS